ncbi:MAG: hypothetical protein QOK37_3084 [Thermoanaerobaculia bacterium]|jgi:hypothetical protein|nr:hypothetical protein [Thermoanaerobaculia bacterium]
MKKTVRTVSVLLVLVLCAAAALAQAQPLQTTPISKIKANRAAYLHEKVRIEGFVRQFVVVGTKSTSVYYLQDDFGSFIKVRTVQPLPTVNKRYAIEGPLDIDPKTKDLFVSEYARSEQSSAPVEPPVATPSVVVPPPVDAATALAAAKRLDEQRQLDAANEARLIEEQRRRTLTYAAIGGAAAIILALGLFLALRSRSSDASSTADYSLASATRVEPPPAPEQVIEGKTIKLHAPPPNTVKLLPGWFEVVSGDDVVKQIRFYKLGGEHGAETTFGRASGRPYAHIQLKAQTVSSRQAKVTFFDGSAQLTNFASNDSNPTKFNGRDLAVNESVPLSESDRVEMGEVALLFHQAPSAATLVR